MRYTQAFAQRTAAGKLRMQSLQYRPFKTTDNLLQTSVQRKLSQWLAHIVIGQANMFGLDHPAFAQRNRLEQHIFQLPHIARPMIMAEPLHGRRCQARQRATDLPAGLVEKMLHQRRQAIEAFTQWWYMQGEHVEAVIKVLAKFATGA
ncbi:hypothetical protein D3C76_955860 [compost metagenome]